MHVRRLTMDEWRVYRSIRLEALREAPYAFGAAATEEEHRFDGSWQQRLEGRVQLVAVRDDAEVGTVGVVDETDGIAEIVSMWVAPLARGEGVGDALVVEAIAVARSQQARLVRLWVSDGNDHARALYERHGFIPTGRTQPVRKESQAIEHEMALPMDR